MVSLSSCGDLHVDCQRLSDGRDEWLCRLPHVATGRLIRLSTTCENPTDFALLKELLMPNLFLHFTECSFTYMRKSFIICISSLTLLGCEPEVGPFGVEKNQSYQVTIEALNDIGISECDPEAQTDEEREDVYLFLNSIKGAPDAEYIFKGKLANDNADYQGLSHLAAAEIAIDEVLFGDLKSNSIVCVPIFMQTDRLYNNGAGPMFGTPLEVGDTGLFFIRIENDGRNEYYSLTNFVPFDWKERQTESKQSSGSH